MKDIFALRLYTRVARLGSFSAAAREFGLSQSQASRTVADLETTLGAKLLSRSTRAVVPTEAGAEFLDRIVPILAALDEAEQSVREGGELRGLVRMSMPTSVGVRAIIPHLAPFLDAHPRLRVQLMLDDRRQDLVRDAVDVAIRLGKLADSTGTARLLTTVPRVIVAAPSYLERHGEPQAPHELEGHRIVAGPASVVASAWIFSREGETVTTEVQPAFSCDENLGAVAAAAAGIGITSASAWSCLEELDDGRLIRLLKDWRTTEIPVYAYFPLGPSTRSTARAVLDHLEEALRKSLGLKLSA